MCVRVRARARVCACVCVCVCVQISSLPSLFSFFWALLNEQAQSAMLHSWLSDYSIVFTKRLLACEGATITKLASDSLTKPAPLANEDD